jgi:hypothetical protein
MQSIDASLAVRKHDLVSNCLIYVTVIWVNTRRVMVEAVQRCIIRGGIKVNEVGTAYSYQAPQSTDDEERLDGSTSGSVITASKVQ